jgi:hypothetical protein
MAITFVEGVNGNNINSGSVAFSTSSVAVGDLLIAHIYINGTFSSVQPLTFTDNVNSGNWTTIGNYYDSTNDRQQSIAYKVCNASGSAPTVSCAAVNGTPVNWTNLHYNGFVGIATYSGDYTSTGITGFSTSTAVAAVSFNTSKANELVVAIGGDTLAATISSGPGGSWTARISVYLYAYDEIVSTQSTAVQFTATLSAADAWYITQAGFYDALPGVGIPWASSLH